MKQEFRTIFNEKVLCLIGVENAKEKDDNVYSEIPELNDGAVGIFRMNLEVGHKYIWPRDYYALVSTPRVGSWEVEIPEGNWGPMS